ncbi:MAG: tRNA 4-thiouridine(8) synthase ThiI, partial [Oscillospiraceae bacterium]|nr:tRNA 4-thiouridine(8) synthase ThiI [Oscillospiraceae bacterium]
MKEVILIKNGEIALKGLNKGNFEAMLIKNIRRKLSVMGIKWSITKAQSTITVKTDDEFADLEMAQELISKVFGISAFSRAAEVEKDFEVIKTTAVEYLADTLKNAKTFKVNAKRADKKFPMTSPEIAMELGGHILSKFHHLKVDVKNPEVTVTVEIRDHSAFIHASKIQGAGGMPLGSSGKAMLLISGGIDSPVAGYMMAKRGLELSAIHFVSPPYTSDRALQ